LPTPRRSKKKKRREKKWGEKEAAGETVFPSRLEKKKAHGWCRAQKRGEWRGRRSKDINGRGKRNHHFNPRVEEEKWKKN